MTAERSMNEQSLALTQLQNLSLRLNVSLSLDVTLDAIIEAAMSICCADCGAISYLNEAGQLNIMRHCGLTEDYIQQRQLTRLDPAMEKIIATGQPLIIEDVEEFAGISANYAAWKKEGVGSIVTLPLVREGQVFGVIGAGSGAPRRYAQTDIEAMAILAAQASAAIINARLFEQLRQANQAKDEFLSTLSHELRTPLTPIIGWAHLLKQFAGLHPMLAEGIETVERNANQLSGLIKDLLDLTRIVSGKVELMREPTSLAELIQSVIAQVRSEAEARAIRFELSLPDEPVVNNVDPVRIRQVVSNLLDNAVKFTPDGGCISVSLSCARNKSAINSSDTIIEVIDTGIGIEPDFLPHIFERFAQGQGGINRRYGGLGLGLAITRAMVEMHGGQVTAESAWPDCGSRFTVRLPLMTSKIARDADGSIDVINDEPENLNLRIIVIEDSRDTLNMLKLWLDLYGCKTFIAANAIEGIKLAAESSPDLIISDIGMPDVDGYEMIRKLRRTQGLEQVPAIALTGYGREEDRELALAAGYNAHIAKPADIGHLLMLIKRVTKNSPAGR
jgi:signal transduction histidine kinase/ActR/RegA family two-component response regulator